MSYEIRTPVCVKVARVADEIMDGSESDNARLSAGRLALSALAHDVRTRIAHNRIVAQEARLIEQVQPEALESRSAAA